MKQISLLFAAFALITFSTNAQQKTVDVNKSILKWTGKKVAGEHNGNISLKSGVLKLKDNKISSGEFIVDMTSITCNDLEDEEWNKKLVGHLESDDFFSVEKHKESKLVIKSSKELDNDMLEVTGELTIKGITKPIDFFIKKKDDFYVAHIEVDRTLYDIRYGSGKFFENLGDNMINDEFIIDAKIVLK